MGDVAVACRSIWPHGHSLRSAKEKPQMINVYFEYLYVRVECVPVFLHLQILSRLESHFFAIHCPNFVEKVPVEAKSL